MRTPMAPALLIAAAALVLVLLGLGGTALGQTDPPALGDGDWTIRDDTVIRDWDVIMLRGDLHVTDGGSLSLVNSTLLFINAEAGEHGIVVDNGGTLRIVEGATVGSSRPNVPLTFVVEAGCTLEIRDSEIEEVGLPAYGLRPDWREIALYIGTPDAVIENTTFTGGLAGPFFDEYVLAPPVRNCTFENVYGIISYGVGIEDCTFRNQNLFGVVFHGGDTGYVARCTFESVFATCVQVGYEYFEPYELHPAEAAVIDTTFHQSTRAIRVVDRSASVITGCTIDDMEREGIVIGTQTEVQIRDISINNTYDAIYSHPISHVDWNVSARSTVTGGTVSLSGNITVQEGATLDLVDFRNLTMWSRLNGRLFINLLEGSILNASGGIIDVPEPMPRPEENWAPITLGPDPGDVRGALRLEDVHTLDVMGNYHIRELRAVNCTFPVGQVWIEEVRMESSSLVPDRWTDGVELTVGGMDEAYDCWFVDCTLDGIERVPEDGPWLVALAAHVVSMDFLYDLKGMLEDGGIVTQGGTAGPATFELYWSTVARVLWQNQVPIAGIEVDMVTPSGSAADSITVITDHRGTTPIVGLNTEELLDDLGYISHLPITIHVNISGLEQSQVVETVEGPVSVELVVFDLLPPRLEMDQGREIATNNTNLTLSGLVVDEHSGVSFVELAILPADYVRVQVDPVTGRFEHYIVLSKGYQTISIRAYDAVGNRRGVLVEAFFSLEPPYVFIDEPMDGSWVNTHLLLVAGMTEEDATVEVQGRETQAENGTFRVPAYLEEGPNLLTVNVTSIAGNHNSTQVLVYLDTQEPFLEVAYPPTSPYYTQEPGHRIRGTVEPGSTVFINQVPVEVSDEGTFTTNQVNLNEGSTQVTIRALDAAGNENVSLVVFVLDSVPPSLVVLVGGEDAMAYTGDEPLRTSLRELVLDITTDEDASLYVDGEPVEMEGRHVTVRHQLVEGVQSIAVRVEDPVGNWMDHPPVRVDVDWTPPALELDPGLPVTTEETLLRLTGTTERNCTVTVNGVRLSVDSSGVFVRNFLLNEGENRLVVVSTDRYGQSSNVTYTVSMVAPEPEPWPEAPSLLPMLLAITVAVLVVEAVVLRLYWGRKVDEGTGDGP